MSRGNALSHTLQAAPGEFDTRSVPATGDCFFDALDLQLPAEGRANELLSAAHMRELVADSLTEEILCATTTTGLSLSLRTERALFVRRGSSLYQMFASAGVDDFAWLRGHHAPTTLEELRAFARIRGRDAGAGHCLWADERAMALLAAEAGVCLLIVDEQATEP